MAEALEVVFRSFWTWFGTWMLVSSAGYGLGGLVRVVKVARKEEAR